MDIKIITKDEGVKLPVYSHSTDAGMDIYANDFTHIKPGETVAIPTGLFMEIPEGYYIMIVPRSGLSKKTPLRLPNSPGIIDSGYRDEVMVLLTNTSDKSPISRILTLDEKNNTNGIYKVEKYDRIAQMILCEKINTNFIKASNLSESERNGGFGHTGIKGDF